MALKIKKNNKKKRVVGQLRRTQLITTFGVGSIVDLPSDSVIVAGTDYWNIDNDEDDEFLIREDNLQNLLGVDYFVRPKIATEENKFSKSKDIPVFRFPEILFCTRCNKIAHYSKFGFTKRPRCVDSGDLIPSRFIVACENGHLEDFPYSWWVHNGESNRCNNPNDLIIFNDKKSGGLDSIKVKCNGCGKTRSMDGAFSKNALSGYKCSGKRPWLREDDTEVCNKILRTLQRGASNVYFSNNVSALSIPPWSSKIQAEISKHWSLYKNIANNEMVLEEIIKSSRLDEKLSCSVKEIVEQIKIKANMEGSDKKKTYEAIIQDEYKAFISGDTDEASFKTEQVEVNEFFKEYIDKVVLVKRLKEVVVCNGFTRIHAYKGENSKVKISPISKVRKNWLPAIEMYGEGIFVKFNSKRIKKWEKHIGDRYDELEKRSIEANREKSNLSARYIFMHTFAHMLIKMLTFECGYSSSALKERIYSTYGEIENSIDMEGILIYTSTSDSDGSLGGLVRQGETENFSNILKKALEESTWCSSDPLCINSKSQGLYSLNYSACHSCALLPETSCETGNIFLDRASIVGTLEDKAIGYFTDLLNIE